MRRFQGLWNSVALLIAAVLAVMCFTRGTLQLWLFAAVFAVWGVSAFVTTLIPAVHRLYYRLEGRKIERKEKERERTFTVPELDLPLNVTVLRHINHRITGYIKSLYPDATWKWKTEKPEQIMAKGGTGRIELFGVEDYNYADVSFDREANIKFSLLKVVDLNRIRQEAAKSEKGKPCQTDVDPQIWYDRKGRVVLKNLIADLASRGHHHLTILDDGRCVIEQGEKTVQVSQLEGFPERMYYPRLIKVLESEGLASKTVDGGLAVDW